MVAVSTSPQAARHIQLLVGSFNCSQIGFPVRHLHKADVNHNNARATCETYKSSSLSNPLNAPGPIVWIRLRVKTLSGHLSTGLCQQGHWSCIQASKRWQTSCEHKRCDNLDLVVLKEPVRVIQMINTYGL